MLKKSFDWVMDNKVLSVIILLFGYMIFFGGGRFPDFDVIPGGGVMREKVGNEFRGEMMDFVESSESSRMAGPEYDGILPVEPSSPRLGVSDRKVIRNANFSLLVRDLELKVEQVESEVIAAGGFLVNKNISDLEGGERAFLEIRVPVDMADNIMNTLRGVAVRVVDEHIFGSDVTDQYYDIDERLRVLNQNKARFEEIMAKAEEVEDILKVQREILETQSQIDSLKGQLQYMEESSKTVLITVNMSTDELDLPYAPETIWRPDAVFKLALHSLIGTFRGAANIVIWLGVYSVVWAPILGGIILFYKKSRKKTEKSSDQTAG